MDATVAQTLEALTMPQLMIFIANLLGAIAVGWLWYLQKRADKRDEKCNEENQQLRDELHRVEREAQAAINAARAESSKQMVDLAQNFVTIYTDTVKNFISKDDFHRTSDALFKKLDKIDEKLDKKADKA